MTIIDPTRTEQGWKHLEDAARKLALQAARLDLASQAERRDGDRVRPPADELGPEIHPLESPSEYFDRRAAEAAWERDNDPCE